jgi:outer membrane protein insertion porin family
MLVASSAALGASAETLGRVTAIEVQGNVRIDSETIINKMSIKIGDQLVEKAVQESFAAVDSLGWFADLGANTVPYLGGVKLIVLVREFPVISRVSISGNNLESAQVRSRSHRQALPGEGLLGEHRAFFV